MKTLLRKMFVDNWQRKLVSLILAMIIWMVVNHSLTVNKTLHNVSVRLTNIPNGKTIEGLQSNGLLNKKISLTLLGNKRVVEQLTPTDLEVVIDARGQKTEWIATVCKNNLLCKNPNINISRGLYKVLEVDLILRLSKLVKEHIPVIVTEPIGEAPKGYQFNDVFPYHLFLTIRGPEEVVKRLKSKGLKLTFNLSEITKNDLNNLQANSCSARKDEISYKVPAHWKKLYIPSLSEKPLAIDDPKAKSLRIDFLKTELIPIQKSIPIDVFYPEKFSDTINPDTFTLSVNGFIERQSGLNVVNAPLYAKGVSKLFLDVVKDRIQIVAIASPRTERKHLLWSVQFIYPHELENRYVAKVLAQKSHEASDLSPKLREEYLRNRFRSYMNRFRLYCEKNEKLALKIELNTDTINALPLNASLMRRYEKNNIAQEQPKSPGGD